MGAYPSSANSAPLLEVVEAAPDVAERAETDA
jgi:hypothetical protein